MKQQITTTFIAVLLLLVTLNSYAQRNENGGGGNSGDMPEKLNCVKINLSSLAYKNIALQYERALGPKIAVACQLRYTLKGNIPMSKTLNSLSGGDTLNVYQNIKMGGWAITPEFRFYPKQALRGFYFAPYLRIRNVNMDYPVTYKDGNNVTQSITSKGNFNSFGGGLMIGSHFNLSESISLDWFIIGFQYMSTNGKFEATTTQTLSASDQQSVKDELASLKTSVSKVVKNFDYAVSSNGFSITGKFGSVGFRGAGLNLGFRF